MAQVTLSLVVEIDEEDAKVPLELLKELIENRACDGINVMEGCFVRDTKATLWHEVTDGEEEYLVTLTEA